MDVVRIAYGIYLFVLAFFDIKKKMVPVSLLLSGLIFIPAFLAEDGFSDVRGNVLGLIPGIIFLLISFVSREQIGRADCILLIILGSCIGIEAVAGIIAFSLILIAICSMVMLTAGRLSRKSTLPYIPFVFLGYLAYIVIIGDVL